MQCPQSPTQVCRLKGGLGTSVSQSGRRCRSRVCRQKIHCSENGNAGSRGKTTVHKLLEQDGVLLVPGCYDALSAKILAQAGHKAAFLSGYAVSATLLGEPDIGLLTPPEMSRKAGQICYAVPSVPILADADTGGGNVLNVQRTIRQLIAAGCKGCFLEDQEWPKRAGHIRGNEVISMEEHAAKVYAARQAIGDSDFFLVARTDARGLSAKHGLDDSITRANLYMDAGADASFVGAARSIEELEEIAKRTKGYRCCNMLEGGLAPMRTPSQLKDIGIHIIVHPLAGLFAAGKAMRNVYTSLLQDGTTSAFSDDMLSFEEFSELIGFEEKMELEESLTRSDRDGKLRVKVKGATKPTT